MIASLVRLSKERVKAKLAKAPLTSCNAVVGRKPLKYASVLSRGFRLFPARNEKISGDVYRTGTSVTSWARTLNCSSIKFCFDWVAMS